MAFYYFFLLFTAGKETLCRAVNKVIALTMIMIMIMIMIMTMTMTMIVIVIVIVIVIMFMIMIMISRQPFFQLEITLTRVLNKVWKVWNFVQSSLSWNSFYTR